MLNLQLPSFDKNAKPVFADAASCAKWVAQFQMTDVRLAHQTLSLELETLNKSHLPALERLKITEQLRDTVALLQDGYAKRIAGKPLPLNESEYAIFGSILSLWAKMFTSYGHCLNAFRSGDQSVSRHLALICQRCLRYISLQIIQYTLMSYQIDSKLWTSLHQFYAFSEEKGFSTVPILDSLKLYPPPSSCADHYIRTILTCRANPYELTNQQLKKLDRWLDEWVSWVKISKEAPASASPPIAVKLDSSSCIVPETSSDPQIRYLDISGLDKNLKIKMALLEQGHSPEQLDLGPNCIQPSCSAFIEHLHMHWCEGKLSRDFERRSINHEAKVCFGLTSLHCQLAGKPFQQPKIATKLSYNQQDEFALFGHVISKEGKTDACCSDTLEDWHVQDESRMGFSLVRGKKFGEQRIIPGSLIGVKLDNREYYIPCLVKWLIVGLQGDINIGLRLWAGIPEAVSMRATGVNLTVSSQYVQAILLDSSPDSKTFPSIIMPSGWYVPKRVVNIFDAKGKSFDLKLDQLVGRGPGFERATFSTL